MTHQREEILNDFAYGLLSPEEGEAREALKADPGNPSARRSPSGGYEGNVQLLRQTARLIRGQYYIYFRQT